MTYFIIASLTLAAVCSIIIIAVKRSKRFFIKIVYTQSDIHKIVKNFLPKDLFDLPKADSQTAKYVRDNTVKVLIMEDQAYWVHNNMFYVAEAVDGMVDAESVKQVDTNNMSNRDIDKMLFILDSLKNGNSNDSGSARNI